MTVRYFTYVPRYLVTDYEAAGWIYAGELGPPHCFYSVLMQWAGEGEPTEPRLDAS